MYGKDKISVFLKERVLIMKKLTAKVESLLLSMQQKAHEVAQDESGMEVIQMLVLLALGLALIAVFIGFRDTIMGTVQDLVDQFLDVFG